MSTLTVAISTHGAYDGYLDWCYASAAEFADEVLVYDDGGECHDPGGIYRPLPKSGSLIPARLAAIAEASSDYVLHLDADDWLCARPKLEADISYADVLLCDSDGVVTGSWSYEGWPTTYEAAIEVLRQVRSTPFSTKNATRLGFLREHALSWLSWPHTTFAEDCRTIIEYLRHNPSLYYGEPFYVYRHHSGQDTANEERKAEFQAALDDFFKGEL